MAKKLRKGDRVAVTGGWHKGKKGTIAKPTDITTSKNRIATDGGNRTIGVTSKHAEKLAEPKQGLIAWLFGK